jgi:hypothetical protein
MKLVLVALRPNADARRSDKRAGDDLPITNDSGARADLFPVLATRSGCPLEFVTGSFVIGGGFPLVPRLENLGLALEEDSDAAARELEVDGPRRSSMKPGIRETTAPTRWPMALKGSSKPGR